LAKPAVVKKLQVITVLRGHLSTAVGDKESPAVLRHNNKEMTLPVRVVDVQLSGFLEKRQTLLPQVGAAVPDGKATAVPAGA
jgi:hypothetical protein